MNRYLYIGFYIDDKCKTNIYYCEKLDKFYKLPLDFTLEEQEEELEIFEERKMRTYEMTNSDEIDALKKIYLRNKKILEIENNRKKEVMEKQEKRDKRRFVIAFTSIFAGIVIYFMSSSLKIEKELENQRPIIIAEKTTDDEMKNEYLDNLVLALESNETITEELKINLINDFTVLLSKDIYIEKDTIETLCERLETYDLTNLDETNYQFTLSLLIFGENSNIVSKCFVTQLDEYANNKNTSELSYLFGLLSSNVEYSLINHIFYPNSYEYKIALARHYNVDISEISDLLDLLELYAYTSDNEQKEGKKKEYLDKLAKLYTKYYRENGYSSNFDSYLLASEIYNGKIKIANNIFSDSIELTADTSEYGTYKMYFNRQTKVDMSKVVYLDKLKSLIEEKGNNLDYHDPDCRFLLYLTILTYEDRLYSYYQDLINNQSASELSLYMIDNIFDKDGYTNVNPEFLYSYFNNGTINVSDVIKEIILIHSDTLSLALFKEYEACLRIEVEEGNISQDDYDSEIYDHLSWISHDSEELYDIIINHIESNTPIFTKFELNPINYEFEEGKVLNYLYGPK